MGLPSSPNNRKEVYLSNIAGQGTSLPSEPITREEEYLDFIAKNGGGGGTGEGDMKKSVYDSDLDVASAGGIKAYTTSAISGKADSSTVNAILDGTDIDSFGDVETALADKVSKSATAGLLKNDGTVDTTQYVSDISGKVDFADIAPAFSASTNYTIGQLVTYNGNLYRFIYDHSAGAWNDNDVAQTTIRQDLEHKEDAVTYDYHDFEHIIIENDGEPYVTNIVNLLKSEKPTAGDEKAVESKGVYDAVISAYDLTKDTVGWANINLMGYMIGKAYKSDTGLIIDDSHGAISKIIPVSEGDKFTASKNATLSQNTDNMMCREYDSTGAFIHSTKVLSPTQLSNTYTVPSGVSYVGFVQFYNSDDMTQAILDTYEIMLYKAEYLATKYEPYHDTTAFPRDEQRVLGAKNLLNNTATTQTINGVTYTVNADKTVSLSNTATANARLIVGSFTAKAGETYILTGAPNSADTSNYLGLYLHGDTQSVTTDTGDGAVIATNTDTLYDVGIRIKSGKDTSGMVFKPMIRLATDPDDTYVPYAMTNRELTKKALSSPGAYYSTSEQVIGQWIDGKPIYQKTILTNTPASDSEVTRVNIGALIDKVIDIKAIFYNENGTSYSMMATNANADKIVRANVQTNICADVSIRNSVEIYATQPSWLDLPCHITIQYTKTTD